MTREEWLKYRRKGIGASDAYILTGDAPEWGTPLKLYEEKISTDEPKEKSNFITDKGNEAESKIRALCELKLGKSFKPALVRSNELPYIMASLDGWSDDQTENLEIKLVGREVWESGVVPKKYVTQIQHQYLASGSKKAYCAMYLESEYKFHGDVSLEFLKIVPVDPDLEYQAELLKIEQDFWENHVLKRKPPEPTDYDYVDIKGYADEVNKLFKLEDKEKEIKKEIAKIKSKLKKLAEEQGKARVTFSKKYRMTKSVKQGSVDYKAIPQLENVDLDKFRKPSSVVWTSGRLKK